MTPSRKRLMLGAFFALLAVVVLLGVVLGQRGGGSPVAAVTTVTPTVSATPSAPSSTTPTATTATATSRFSSSLPATSSATPSASAVVTSSAAAPGAVSVVVTVSSYNPAASDVEFGAFVQGVVESGGSCVVTMRKGTLTASGRAAALPNAKNTSCGDLRVLGSAVSTGTWTATVAYISPTSSGSSAPTTVEVP